MLVHSVFSPFFLSVCVRLMLWCVLVSLLALCRCALDPRVRIVSYGLGHAHMHFTCGCSLPASVALLVCLFPFATLVSLRSQTSNVGTHLSPVALAGARTACTEVICRVLHCSLADLANFRLKIFRGGGSKAANFKNALGFCRFCWFLLICLVFCAAFFLSPSVLQKNK